MKKIFLAALVALAFSSYSYAQDDMYEEDSPRAATAPAAPSYSEPAKSVRSEGGDAFMGISLDLLGMLNNNVQRFGLVFKLAPDMELTGIIGLQIYGDVDGEDNEGKKVEGAEGGARISLGAGFDFFFETGLLPISIGGDLIFTHLGEDNNELDFDIMFGMRAEIVKNFCVNGKLGFNTNYHWWTEGNVDWSQVNFGIAARINLTWFFL